MRPVRHRGERGSAVVDFVMLLVVLLPLFIGLLQLALVLHVRNTLSSAAAEGARSAAVAGATPQDGVDTAREQIVGALSPEYAQAIRVEPVAIGGAPAYELTIDARVPTLGLGGIAIEFSVSGNAVREEAS
ncbi:TadE/TadG family type IV pilus assembly protein [Nocardioides sp. Soil805]|uniref:TadE/TadG family type IV pilus assembly protein n=1 Tax=Nocardioides sp. Soil805 TaxID=1736416 RepID=UPI000B1F4EA6|nr:TadE/TadG family type IV pilus assembly protein [Nocardioides sp. Soil805]